MVAMPENVDRLYGPTGFRYVAYARFGRACRLQRQPGCWDAYEGLSGRFIGRGDTLHAIGRKVAVHLCDGDA